MAAITQKNRQIAVETPLGEDKLLLVSFAGQEEMSRLFQYRLEMYSTEDSVAANKIVGKSVTFQVQRAGQSPRYFNGFVSRFAAGSRETGFRNYVAEVVPWLWFLGLTADCRIFQNKSVPEIIEQIFGDLGFSDYETGEIKGTHNKRDYCVQYRESDLNFVSRLMEEEGILYFFKHEKGKHTLILADQKGAYKDLPEKDVEYEYSYTPVVREGRLTSWEHQYEYVSGKWAQTDYNFKDHPARGEPTPSNLLMADEKTTIKLDNIDKYEIYDYPGRYADKDAGKALTRLRIEEQEAMHDVVRSGGSCATFSPGGKFTVERHDAKSEEGKGYVITSISHSAIEPASYTGGEVGALEYRNTFTCIPDSVTFRPRRTTPRPVVHGVQSAVVTGPGGEEIYPDQYGRVKVQFFWDREGTRDENTSCWVRVSHAYAGKNWGAVSIPRIGQEVVVDFEEGDPDRPIIIGRVYNADQMPPYGLPGQKMLSGLKSESTKGGGGYNEYVMDDTKSNELIREHGQFDKDSTIEHDLREHVLHDRERDVTHDETIKVGHDRNEKVVHDETLNVGHDRSETIGSDRTKKVGKNETVSIGENRTESVKKNETISIGENRTESVKKNETITIGENRTESVKKNENITIGENRTESVGKNENITIREVRGTSVGKDDSLDVGKNLAITAGDSITITTGKASITMKKDGTITINGKDISITGSGQITGKASKDIVLKGKKILQN